MTASCEIVVKNKVGLHARPARIFVKTANSYSSTITLKNISKDTDAVNAKSILSILTSNVLMDDLVLIEADGNDEEEAVATLCNLIEADFQEAE